MRDIHPIPSSFGAPRSIRLALATAASLASAASVWAAPPETIQTRSVETLASHCCWDNWLNIQTAGGAENFYQVNSWGQSWATAQAQTAQFGRLAGELSAGSQMPDVGYNGSGGAATLRDAWSDIFTISSSSWVAGTPVDLKLTVLLDVSMLAIDPDGSAGSAEAAGRAAAAFHQGGWDAPWITGLELRTGSGQADSQLDGVYSQSAVFTTAVGQTVHLVGDLSLSFNHRSSTLARDWSSGYTHGAAIYRIDVLTPDVDVSTGSGFDYATPVPEPRTWALMLAGLCAVGLSVRRRAA